MFKKKAEDDGGKLKVVDVTKKESEIEAKEIHSLGEVITAVKEKFPGLVHVRIPICNSANPLERDFDALCATMVGSNVNCPVIVNCQVQNINFCACCMGLPEGTKITPKVHFLYYKMFPVFQKKTVQKEYFFLS